jgi:hypothetical protein
VGFLCWITRYNPRPVNVQPPGDERAMLTAAIERAQRLLADLESQQADLDRNPPKIAKVDLIVGREAMQNAIASTRRMLVALRAAEQVAVEQGIFEPRDDCGGTGADAGAGESDS